MRSARLVAAEPGHSVLVVGPTQSGKTTGLAVPAILEWEGPVVAASVKSDLLIDTVGWRSTRGQVMVYDPTGSTGRASDYWSPLESSGTWGGARHVARALVEVARSSSSQPMADADFWYATAAKLIAPMLHAAALGGLSMADVVRWLDTEQVAEVGRILDKALEEGSPGASEALQAAEASWNRDPRQRSSVYATAETVLEVFADPSVAASATRAGSGWNAEGSRAVIDPTSFLDGESTLYLCAPAHHQRLVRPVFASLVSEVIEQAYTRSSLAGVPLDPPLLVVLDEAANVAPLAELDVLASTAAGHGVQLLTIWQDLAQVTSRYGSRAGSIVNNHRAKLFLSGIADPETLEHVSRLAGEAEHEQRSMTRDASGMATTTDSPVASRLLAPDAMRRLEPGRGVLVYGHLPPAELALRPWYEDDLMIARQGAHDSARQGAHDSARQGAHDSARQGAQDSAQQGARGATSGQGRSRSAMRASSRSSSSL